ncbi:hypothetical protein PMAYCL1PPCAC_18080, partial [Pristionchus mayeri]
PEPSPLAECHENVNQLSRRVQITTMHTRIANSVAGGDNEIVNVLSKGMVEVEPRNVYTQESSFPFPRTTYHTVTNLTESAITIRVTCPSPSFSFSLSNEGKIDKGATLTVTIQQKEIISSKVKIRVHVISGDGLLSPYIHPLLYHPPSAVIHSLQSLLPFKPTTSLPSITPLLAPISTPPPDPSSINNSHLGILLLALQNAK